MRFVWACLIAGVLGCGAAPRPVAPAPAAPAPRRLPPGVFGVVVHVVGDDAPLDGEVFALAAPRYRACWVDSELANPATPSSTRTELSRVDGKAVLFRSGGTTALDECVERSSQDVDLSTMAGNRVTVELTAATSSTDTVVVVDESTGLAAHDPMQARRDEVMACHATWRRGDPLLAGSVSVFLWFGRDGTVDGRGEIVSDVSKPLTDCVVGAVSNAVMTASTTDRRYALVLVRLGTTGD